MVTEDKHFLFDLIGIQEYQVRGGADAEPGPSSNLLGPFTARPSFSAYALLERADGTR